MVISRMYRPLCSCHGERDTTSDGDGDGDGDCIVV